MEELRIFTGVTLKRKWPDLTQFKELRKKVKSFYKKPDNICGGNLHILLDDGNINNDDIEYCYHAAKRNNDHDGVKICEMFYQMRYLQRLRLIRGRYGPV